MGQSNLVGRIGTVEESISPPNPGLVSVAALGGFERYLAYAPLGAYIPQHAQVMVVAARVNGLDVVSI